MMNALKLLVSAGLALLVQLGPVHAGGQILKKSFHSDILNIEWDYVVYLPEGYNAGLRYPIMYLLHGNNGAADDFVELGGLKQTADTLIEDEQMPPAIIVTPSAGVSWYINRDPVRMQDAFFNEFMPRVEKTENVIGTRATRLIGGISMGGYGSLRYVMKFPELFSAAALMSPAAYAEVPHPDSSAVRNDAFGMRGPDGKVTFDRAAWQRESYPTLLNDYLAKKQPVRFYIESGDGDEFEIHDQALRLYRFLREHKQKARFSLSEGAHDWATWTEALSEGLRYVFLGVSKPVKASG